LTYVPADLDHMYSKIALLHQTAYFLAIFQYFVQIESPKLAYLHLKGSVVNVPIFIQCSIMCNWYCLHIIQCCTQECVYVSVTHFHCHNVVGVGSMKSAAVDHNSFPDPVFCIMSLDTLFPPPHNSHKIPLHCQVFRDLKEGRQKEAKVKYCVLSCSNASVMIASCWNP